MARAWTLWYWFVVRWKKGFLKKPMSWSFWVDWKKRLISFSRSFVKLIRVRCVYKMPFNVFTWKAFWILKTEFIFYNKKAYFQPPLVIIWRLDGCSRPYTLKETVFGFVELHQNTARTFPGGAKYLQQQVSLLTFRVPFLGFAHWLGLIVLRVFLFSMMLLCRYRWGRFHMLHHDHFSLVRPKHG